MLEKYFTCKENKILSINNYKIATISYIFQRRVNEIYTFFYDCSFFNKL